MPCERSEKGMEFIMQKKYKVAVIGATGLVGRTALKVLEEKDFSNIQFTLFSSKKSAGTKLEFMGTNYIIQELTENSFNSGFDYAIFCAGGEISKKYIPIAVSKKCICIDNSSFYRMNPDVPLVVPEVNPSDIYNNPNNKTITIIPNGINR